MTTAKKAANILEKKMHNALAQALENTALIIELDAKTLCSVKTGALRASITHEVDKKRLQAWVYTDMKYAPMVEFGTAPHEIKAKNAKALTIPKAGGELVWRGEKRMTKIGKKVTDVIFRKKVWHPGTSPKPFIRPAFDRNRDVLVEEFVKNLKKF